MQYINKYYGNFISEDADGVYRDCKGRIQESKVVSNDADVIVGGGKSPFCFGNESESDDFLRSISGFPFDKVSEIARCEIRFFCKI